MFLKPANSGKENGLNKNSNITPEFEEKIDKLKLEKRLFERYQNNSAKWVDYLINKIYIQFLIPKRPALKKMNFVLHNPNIKHMCSVMA